MSKIFKEMISGLLMVCQWFVRGFLYFSRFQWDFICLVD